MDAGSDDRLKGARAIAERAPGVDPARRIAGWASLGLLAYLVYLVVHPFLLPLGWAAVFAIVIHPLHAALVPRLGRTGAAAASTAAITLALVLPAALVLPVFAREAVEAAADVQRALVEGRFSALERIWDSTAGIVPATQQVDLAGALSDAVRRGAAFVVAQSGLILRDAAVFLFDLVVALFATFFLLRDAPLVMRSVRRLLPMTRRSREALIARTSELVVVGATSAVIVAAVQGLFGGVVFWALGIEAPVFWGVVMALFCLLPFGAWVVWLPAAVLLAVNGQTGRAIVLAGMGFGIVSAADNVLRPILVSGRSHINGLAILVGLLGGVSAFGLLGIVLGPILVATALALLKAYASGDALGAGEFTGMVEAPAAAPGGAGNNSTALSKTPCAVRPLRSRAAGIRRNR